MRSGSIFGMCRYAGIARSNSANQREGTMCGRFVLQADYEGLATVFPDYVFPDGLPNRYNIAPTQSAVVAKNDLERSVELVRWGLIPSWSKDHKIGSRLINARSETAAEKPSFRSAYKRRRCLVPVSGYYEWMVRLDTKAKQPVFIWMGSGMPFALAGLWEVWHSPEGDEVHTFTILTTDANELVAPFHHRMPVILGTEHFEEWLNPEEKRVGDLEHLLHPWRVDNLVVHPVSTLVNSPANDLPECIEAVSD